MINALCDYNPKGVVVVVVIVVEVVKTEAFIAKKAMKTEAKYVLFWFI